MSRRQYENFSDHNNFYIGTNKKASELAKNPVVNSAKEFRFILYFVCNTRREQTGLFKKEDQMCSLDNRLGAMVILLFTVFPVPCPLISTSILAI